VQVKIEGLDEHIEGVVRRVLAEGGADDPWMNSAQAAAYLDMSPGTFRNHVSAGRLKRHGVPGTRLRFRRSELDRFAEGRRS
jgi:excisionase family DNA binding protein